MSTIFLALIVTAQIIVGLLHAPLWVSIALILISAIDFGFHLGRFTRREVIYIHHDSSFSKKNLNVSAENLRYSYREANQPIPIVIAVPYGMKIDRQSKI